MPSALDSLLQAVKNSITDHANEQQHTGFDAGGLLNKVTELFGQHQRQQGDRNVRPASEDPYGDPGSQPDNGAYGNARPASEDPYGDPADQPGGGQGGRVKPASQDPYGDPADQ